MSAPRTSHPPSPSSPLHSPSPPAPPAPATWPPPTSVLPDSLYLQDSRLYTHLTHGIQTKFGLASPERLVLLGVLKHMPIGPLPDHFAVATTLIDRILSLDPVQIKHLAEIFTNGLLDARSWGGIRKTVCSRAISRLSIANSLPDTAEIGAGVHVLDAGYSDIFEHLQISPFPRQTARPDNTANDKPQEPLRRTAKHSRACLKRQNSHCPLTTQSDIGLETAHLIPHSVAALKKSETSFWLLVAICLGPELRDQLYSIIRGADSYSTANGLVLDCRMHKYFDKGVFYLLPLPDTTFDTNTSHYLDVCFRWKYSPDNLSLCFTRLPTNPEEQTHITAAGTTTQSFVPLARQIGDGDIFRLFTDDPARLPLPHPFLLSLHSVLWEMIGSAGLGETAQEKRKRLQRPAGHGDSDDSNDDSRPMSRKRTKRNKKEGRGKEGPKQQKQTQKEQESTGNADPGGPSFQTRTCQADVCPSFADDTHTLNNSPPTSAPPTMKGARQSGNMTFLEREYLAFKLRQLQSGDLDFELDNDTDSESDASSSFSLVEDFGPNTSPLASGTPVTGGDKPFLLNEYLAFQKRQRNTGDCLDGGTDCSSSKVRHCTDGYSSSSSSSDINPDICSPARGDNHDGVSPCIAG